MHPKLSIIIPCYNCEKTVEEAVESCYIKRLNNFEIIMVDDGSTDNTKNIIKKLAERYKEIQVINHDKNKGGGAARNTGIKNATGDLIFCLDSDNILDPESLEKMIIFLFKNKLDGVVFYERRFFHSKNKKHYSAQLNPIKNEHFVIDSLFDDGGLLLDNFLFTKESFLKTKRYPEHHGFDTQSYEMRYLSIGNKVLTCPNTIFYHRQNDAQPSYFEREFNKGNFSLNYYLAIEDIWNLLSMYAKKEIITYDIFKKSSLQENLSVKLKNLYKENILFKKQITGNESNLSIYESYDNFIINYQQKRFDEALDISKKLLKNKIDSKIIYFSILRASVGLSGEDSNNIENKTNEIIKGLIMEPKILNKWYHRNLVTLKTIQLIRKIWKK